MTCISCVFRNAFKWTLLASLIVMSAARPALAVGQMSDPCARATRVDLGSSWRSPGQLGSDPDYYEISVPSPGFVTVDVAVSAGAADESKIAFLGQLCQGDSQSHVSLVERHIQGIALFIEEPGVYTFAVAAQDSLRSLPGYKVRASFVSKPAEAEPFALRSRSNGLAKSELDPEPDGEEPGPVIESGSIAESEPDPIPDGFMYPGSVQVLPSNSLPAFLPPRVASVMCHQAEVDDHGDTFLCATSLTLGSTVNGELSNAWGDDEDLFSFALTSQRTVRILSGDGADIVVFLYDRYGHRLVIDDPSGGTSLRIVKTLGPGRYFVRVAGRNGADGQYTLSATTFDW